MSWQERRCNAEGFGRPEPFFFLCEERTYSPPGCRPGGGTAATHQSCALRGGLRSLRRAPGNAAEPAGVGRHCLCGCQRALRPVCSFAANCCPLSGQPAIRLRKPATAQGTPFGCGSFVAVMDDASPAPSIFFCPDKRNKTAPCRGQKGSE